MPELCLHEHVAQPNITSELIGAKDLTPTTMCSGVLLLTSLHLVPGTICFLVAGALF